MNIELFLLIPTILINILMGLLAVSRGPHRNSSRYFAASTISLSLWAAGDFLLLSAKDPSLVHFGTILFYVGPMLAALFLVFFSRTFPGNTKISVGERALWTSATLILIAAILFKEDFLTQSITVAPDALNVLAVNPVGYAVYALFFSIGFITSYINLYRTLRKSYGHQRNQIRYSLAGIFLTSFLGSVTNLFWPLFVDGHLIWLGPLFTISHAITTTIAIVKHRLFDIRLIVARSMAYALLLVSLALLYALVIFATTSLFFRESYLLGGRDIVYILLAVFLSFTFQPLKRFFDKVTNRIFYRDAYDSQQVLDQLGATLVSATSVHALTSQSFAILQHAVKPTFIYLVLMNHHVPNGHERTFKVGGKPKNIAEFLPDLSQVHDSLIIQDEIPNQSSRLYKHMQESNVAILARLQTSKETVGYALFGYRASGNAYGDQDINLIKIAMDELAVAIQNALRFEEIQAFNETLQDKVNKATVELRESNKKLLQLDKAKDEFISMASHQLRTPLTSIKGYLSMAIDGDAGRLNPAQYKLLDEAFAGTQRMVYLIGDFLNVSRIQTGKFMLESKPVQLARIVREEIAQLQSTAERRTVAVEYHEPASFPVLQLDENKMRQVVMNLVDNAIFYSKPGGAVKIVLLATANEARFEVHDSGIGVPEDERHKLFTKFYRAENARKVRPDGTGIGLFMAKKVVLSHGGSVIFESKEGKGSTFGFSFPLVDGRLKNEPQELKNKVPEQHRSAPNKRA